MKQFFSLLSALFMLFLTTPITSAAEEATGQNAETSKISAKDAAFFETNVRPVLVEHCYKCHGKGKHKGNLQLDGRGQLLLGGDSGPAIVPGNPEESLLIQAINYDGYEMPPDQKLSAKKIEALTKWIRMGAPWPGSSGEAVAPVRKGPTISDEDRKWWSFQPIVKPELPHLQQATAPQHPIDAFVLAKLEEKHLSPNPPASAHSLIRRAFFDLIGLPPTPREMSRWTARLSERTSSDNGVNQAAWAELIDELLARPQYGERWGRHWLDVVRFAQTNGYERDHEKPYAWRYRDYVVQAFNKDKPYDRFVLEQLAGDELPDANRETRIATGFYRLGLWDDEPDDAQQAEFDDLDDIIVTTSAAFLGLTVGCARCHDHKFDPILHQDYYSLLSFFRNIRRYANPDDNPEAAGLLPISDSKTLAAALQAREERRAKLQDQIENTEDKKKKEQLKRQKKDETLKGVEWALAVREHGQQVKDTHILIRGNAQTPGDVVEPTFPQVLGGESPKIVPPDREAPYETSGRRLAFAQWLIRPDHPLTARVMANRIWHYHFGRGIVATTSDFGQVGVPPTHPQLLDWLASRLINHGWSVKDLHRQIMLSQTYQRSSSQKNELARAIDPGNTLLWRQNLHRLEAEAIRDSILFVSGSLNSEMGGRGFFPLLAAEVLAGGTNPGAGWEISNQNQRNRRSLYTFIKRTIVAPQLDTFDYANTSLPLTERPTTTVAPQALMLLNDRFIQTQATEFANRVRDEADEPTLDARISRAFEIALNRTPTDSEVALSRNFIEQQQNEYAALRTRLVFRPLVPVSLDPGFIGRLKPKDFVETPEHGWVTVPGKWRKFNRFHELDISQGPTSLWQGAVFRNGRVSGTITLGNASELAGVLLRAKEHAPFVDGYEILLSPRDSELSVIRHSGTPQTLGQMTVPIPTDVPIPIECELYDGKLNVQLGKNGSLAKLQINDPKPLAAAGRLGVRTWGAAVTIDDLTLEFPETQLEVATALVDEHKSPARKASTSQTGWTEFDGHWSLTSDGTLTPQPPTPGGKVIWNNVQFADGMIESDVKVRGGGDAGLIVRVNDAQPGVDALVAYNINFSEHRLRLGKHQQNWRELVSVPHHFPSDRWSHLKAEFIGPRIRIFVDDAKEPLIDYTDPDPLPPGKVGFRTFHCPVEYRNLIVRTPQSSRTADFGNLRATEASRISVIGTQPDTSQRQAFEAFCLMVLNLNEMIYVD